MPASFWHPVRAHRGILNRVEYRAAEQSNKTHREIRLFHWFDIFSAKFKLCYIIIVLLIIINLLKLFLLWIYMT